jgi:hypothetical protein
LVISKDKKALLKFCDTSHWRSPVALTLNLKQSFQNNMGQSIMIDEYGVKKAFKRYIHALNRRVYRSAYRHHGKRLRTIPVLEKSQNGRYHYHIAIEPPLHLDSKSFGELAMETWLESDSAYRYGEVSLDTDFGWLVYMAKYRTKSDFEHYFDCIDTEAYYNPGASA